MSLLTLPRDVIIWCIGQIACSLCLVRLSQTCKRLYDLLSDHPKIVSWRSVYPAKNILLMEASHRNEPCIIDFLIKKYSFRRVFYKKCSLNWNWGLYGACTGGHQDLAKFFIRKGANRFDFAVQAASSGNHKELIDYLIEKNNGLIEMDSILYHGLYGASRGNHIGLIGYFIAAGAYNWNIGLQGAALGGHKELIEYFIQLGADVNNGLYGASEGGNFELVSFFLEKGADNLNVALRYATNGGQLSLIKFLIKAGATNVREAKKIAIKLGYQDIVDFLDEGTRFFLKFY